jgi:hypothetical protein
VFTAPIWLLGLAALAIPLLLHLWSRRPRQVIRVGTLRHVDLTADARSWSARLTDPLLLALRLALLITIVFALAGLRLPARRSAGTGATLVLLDPALLADTTPIPFLDSIARERDPVRLLLPGLPKLQLDGKATPRAALTPATDLWASLAEADALVGPRGTLHVLARPRLAVLRGARPHLRAEVEWHVPAGAPRREWTPVSWADGDTMRMVVASGDASGASYLLGHTLAPSCPGCTAVPPRRVAVLASDSLAESRIETAVRAIAAELSLPITSSSVDSADVVLTDLPLSDSLLARGAPLVPLAPATVSSAALADSLWQAWPWPLVARDRRDQRQVSLAQALPAPPGDALAALGDPEATRRGLLLLALLLFVVERWLATRPGRREA